MDGLELIHEAQERDRKDLLQPRLRSAQTQSEPSPDQRFVGVRAHGRSECEEARSSALPIRAKHRAAAAPDGLTHSNGRMGTKLTVCSDLGGLRGAFK